ncbi:Asx homology domain-containing protein [Aspergillus coremiiformis]|uniref:Asx homology domain-containing protein n=1 Tax=Aspergillus coremiiformis TaxID=138285 RepID=A0A5N6ZAV0_9EURO|nr:Asx homology domain-containing protein [Aspergillus coremiiformis]
MVGGKKILANPEAWNCLDESEKKEILGLLPEDIHPNPDPSPDDPDAKIPALPESFLRYSNNWRDAVRHFQLNLQHGRYDPGWLREAEQAMQQRANGNFDKFKEEEFEQFWGQKQKMDKTLVAGQSRQVKLSTLVDHGVVLVGDVWKYSRAFSKCKPRLLVEKEARIVDLQHGRLTFAFPPGQRVFLPAAQGSTLDDSAVLDKGETGELRVNEAATVETELHGTGKASGNACVDTHSTLEAGSSKKRKSDVKMEPRKKGRGRSRKAQVPENLEEDDQVEPSTGATGATQLPSTEAHSTSATVQIVAPENGAENLANTSEQSAETAEDAPPQTSIAEGTSEEPEVIIVSGITGPAALATKILEADGRAEKIPHGNAWKEFRAYRNNQDMGSLWEVRQAWFQRNK